VASLPHGLPGRGQEWRAHEIEHMKPPLPRTLSAVPRLLHVQIEIAKAIRTLAEQDEQRRAETIASIFKKRVPDGCWRFRN
jgi:hypothetical protein